MRPFFSRRIGLDADGAPIPIAYGARLSGNLSQDTRIGIMNLQTRKTDEFDAQNYTSISVQQQVLNRSLLFIIVMLQAITSLKIKNITGSQELSLHTSPMIANGEV